MNEDERQMLTYEEYREKVYMLFIRDHLKAVSTEEKIRYLEENEDFIRREYKADVYGYCHLDQKLTFTDHVISGSVCMNLDMLY